MEQTHFIMLLLLAFIFAGTHAQMIFPGSVDTDWLMDDPHKADRLPIWSQLLGNRQGFGFGTRSTSNNGRWNNSARNSWQQTLSNLYRVILWRQMLNNQNSVSHGTVSNPPRAAPSNRPTTNNSPDWKNRLQNMYRIALWNQLLSNQQMSNTNNA